MSNNCVLQKFFFDWFCVTTKAKKGILKIQNNNNNSITPEFPPETAHVKQNLSTDFKKAW